MQEKQSRTVAYLKGKRLDGTGKTVEDVQVKGTQRIVTFKDGSHEVMHRDAFMDKFIHTMNRHQAASSKRGMRKLPGGKVAITLGGKQRGERKIYSSESEATKALSRKYGNTNKRTKAGGKTRNKGS